ncbi:MAG: putative methyltransferase [Actinobacteria bacterium]|nr:MAG: putative methyltransferase [Actinomycetota bacterium]
MLDFVQLPMRLYAMDAWVKDTAVLVDEDGLRTTLRAAADAGSATVLAEEFYVFANGAVTGVLLLAQSHLSIHTWPELLMANVDLLSYGVTREQVVSEVAAAVGLDEGEAGVLDVLGVVARFEPVAVRTISRLTDLPIPISAAVCNELRRRDVVSRRRPVRLTPAGRELFADAGAPGAIDSVCATCGGRGIVVDASLEGVARELAVIADACPSPRFEIDQTHCTVDTKLRRVLALHESRALVGKRVLLLGDDDITSVAIKFVREALVGAPFDVEVVAHDLRDPLPARLHGSADTVFTDPPYTVEGAALFLSRAAEAVGTRNGRRVFLAFGGRRPEDVLRVQRAIVDAGMTVRRLIRNFNEYRGAGALGGTSHLYELVTTSLVRSLVSGRYDGALYTGDRHGTAPSQRPSPGRKRVRGRGSRR